MNGTLPAVGTSCPIDIELFPSANATAKRTILSAEEKRSMDAGWEISKAARKIIPRRVL